MIIARLVAIAVAARAVAASSLAPGVDVASSRGRVAFASAPLPPEVLIDFPTRSRRTAMSTRLRPEERQLAFFPIPSSSSRAIVVLGMSSASKEEEEDEVGKKQEAFWAAQKALAASMTETADKNLKEEQLEKYRRRSATFVSDTAFFAAIIFAFLWTVSSTPLTALSHLFGASLGTAYSYGLTKYVESLGGSADEADDVQGAGVGQARFAFLVLLFIIVGKFRGEGLQEIPSIAGFFTYQIASLFQALREYDED